MTTLQHPADAPARIRELSASVAGQIAAGEVVERPAAALKELLENALDGGARRITVEIEGAGLERLAVRDDGAGIRAAELELAFRRHATSKLSRAEQLWALDGYGFRGEALAAIAAAAGRLLASSRMAEDPVGSQISYAGGRLQGLERCARGPGTSVELWELFAQQPARRAFLPGPRSERAALTRVAADAVLARPDVGLRLELEGRVTLRHDPAASDGGSAEPALREAWASVFGAEPAERAIWWAGEDAELRVEGLAGAPRDGRRGREGLRLFVNGRPVRDRSLAWALQEAYRGWLPAGRFPLVVARLSAPPDQVDVNVHPTKAEVQLREPARAFSLLQRTLRAALAGQPSSSTLRLRRPDRDLEWAPQADGVVADGPIAPDAAALQGRIENAGARPAAAAADPRRALPRAAAAATPAIAPDAMPDAMPNEMPGAASGPTPGSPPIAAGGAAEPLPGSAPRSRRRGLAPLRMVGQLHRTFVIAEGEQGLVLVDQHAAHERVVYERLLAARSVAGRPGAADEGARQPLLDPPVVALDAAESAVWSQAAEQLAGLGFELDEWGERALRLRAVPAGPGLGEAHGGASGELTAADAERWLRDVLAELGGDTRRANEQRFDRVAASVACHGSVRRGVVLDAPAMVALLRQLEACADPHSCPHGRPTLIEIAAADLLREFGRS